MHRHTSRFADGHQTRLNLFGAAGTRFDHLALIGRRDAAHVVMHCRDHGDGFLRDVDAGENTRSFGNTRQTLVDDIGIEMFDMQMDMIAIGTDTSAVTDFHGHRPADDIARCEILCRRRKPFHETLAL